MAAKSKMRKTAIAGSGEASTRLSQTRDSQPKLSHYDSSGRATMVDVSGKAPTVRMAEASARVVMSPKVLAALPDNPKGDPFEVARIAGIQAAKRTWELIPMCHPVALSFVDISYSLCEDGVALLSRATTTAGTGVEMEALTAVSVAALTIYDMCKALDKGIEIRSIQLERKQGGKSGEYQRSSAGADCDARKAK
ncbi:MAG: cyclic pyranopterin monophosphate synthase MoaC [Candidatus Korobacteraceae bacterium]